MLFNFYEATKWLWVNNLDANVTWCCSNQLNTHNHNNIIRHHNYQIKK